MIVRVIVEEYLDKTSAVHFMTWAFDYDYEELNPLELCYRWNERHSKDAFRISPSDEIENTIYKMMLWWLAKVKNR